MEKSNESARVALVTGADGGIGGVIALRLAPDEIQQNGQRTLAVTADAPNGTK